MSTYKEDAKWIKENIVEMKTDIKCLSKGLSGLKIKITGLATGISIAVGIAIKYLI